MSDGFKLRLRACILLSTVVVLSGCSDGSGIESPRTLGIVVVPNVLDVTQGGTVRTAVGVARPGGYDGVVTLSVDGLPTGVTASAVTIPSGSSHANIDFVVSTAAAVGTSLLTIRATGENVVAATTSIAFTIRGAGGFTLSLSSNTASVAQGESATRIVNIARNGSFTGAVHLTATNLPTSMTATFNPPSTTGPTSALTLTSSVLTPVGTYALAVRGTGAGASEKTVTLNVTVVPPALFPHGTLLTQGPGGLFLIQTDGSNRRALATVASDDMAPQWNPSGTEAVFHDRFVSNRLAIVNLNGQVRPQNAGIPGISEQFWPEYSADGTWIYFQAYVDAADTYRIWRIRSDGTGAQQVSPTVEFISAEAPSPSPNGQEVAYTLRWGTIPFEVVIQNLATGVRRSLGAGFGVRWSPDGLWLAFVDGVNLVVQRADGTQRRVLNAGVPYRTGLDWTIDSQWVVARQDNIDGGIDLVKIDGSRVRNVPNTQDLRQPSLRQ